ncbi:MAG: hypothetical protein AB8G15_13370 [Saprospiraceae bacterium]
MSQEENNGLGLFTMFLIVGGMVVVALFVRTFFWAVFFALILAGIISGSYYLIRKAKTRAKHQPNSPQAKIEAHLKWSTTQTEKNLSEIDEIKMSIQELKKNINPTYQINERALKEHQRILAGFEDQLQLRKTKLEFYEACQQKLETLQYNYQLTKDLANKQKRLSELQENHYEDIASMERLKSDFEYDQDFLQNIEMLSLKVLASNSIDSAKELQVELMEMTKEIKKL